LSGWNANFKSHKDQRIIARIIARIKRVDKAFSNCRFVSLLQSYTNSTSSTITQGILIRTIYLHKSWCCSLHWCSRSTLQSTSHNLTMFFYICPVIDAYWPIRAKRSNTQRDIHLILTNLLLFQLNHSDCLFITNG
jgi:hypothetical protein